MAFRLPTAPRDGASSSLIEKAIEIAPIRIQRIARGTPFGCKHFKKRLDVPAMHIRKLACAPHYAAAIAPMPIATPCRGAVAATIKLATPRTGWRSPFLPLKALIGDHIFNVSYRWLQIDGEKQGYSA